MKTKDERRQTKGERRKAKGLPSSVYSFPSLLCAALVVSSARPANLRAQQLQAPEFVARPVDGSPVRGKLIAIDKSWRITLQGPQRLSLGGADLVSLQRPDRWPPDSLSGAELLLANGDRIRAITQQATQDVAHIHSELLGELDIPLERVSGVLLNPPNNPAAREQLRRRLSKGRRKQDVVILSNGDEIAGSFLGLDGSKVQVDGTRGAISINRSGVQAIAMSSELISFPKPTQLYADVTLTDGSVLAFLDGQVVGSNWRGRAALGRDTSVPLEQLVGFEFRGGRVTYLSDLEPVEYRHTPYLGIAYPLERDRSVQGNVLSLRGQVYRKGIGLHSRSELSYRLDANYRRFDSTVGIDDETAGRGSVVFRVQVDGKTAWESPPLTGRSAPVAVSVPLRGATEVTLVVDFADLGDVQDHADWAEARLVR